MTAQVRLGYDSDSNFMPQWFPDEYRNGLPVDESLYLKHQHGSEVASFLAEWQPNRVVSTADDEQENREVSHLPELRYERVGDSLLGDRLTFFSDNDAAGEKFVRSELSLKQQGFYDGRPAVGAAVPDGSAARACRRTPTPATRARPPTAGTSGRRSTTRSTWGWCTSCRTRSAGTRSTARGVARRPAQPPGAGGGRCPAGGERGGPEPAHGGGGVRLTTDFWRVDDAVQSDLFDLHRLRHVVTPEVTLFASGQTVDQNRLYIYDPQRDALNDVQAAQLALRQRWQTKRGGPGKWRSVDFLTLDVYANLFANQPAVRFRDPADFRSVFLQSEPEYSLPAEHGQRRRHLAGERHDGRPGRRSCTTWTTRSWPRPTSAWPSRGTSG